MSKTVACARNLRSNAFPMYEVQPDDIPFWILVASTDATGEVIGYLTVRTVMTLRNPICGAATPPVTAAGMMSFDHDAEKGTTTLSVIKDAFNNTLAVGQDILFTFGRNLINTSTNILTQVLSVVKGALIQVLENKYVFAVDSNYATQQALGYVIGRAVNF